MVQHSSIDHTGITGVGGSVATDAIWDAAGDLAVGSGANTASKLTKGSDGDVLTVTAGAVGWAAPAGGGGGTNYAFIQPAFADWTASTGTWARMLQTDTGDSALNSYPGFQNTSNAQNDAKSIDLWMDAGTYTVTITFRKSSNTGIITVNLDGSSQGTIDTYAASPVLGTGSVTGITVSAGKRTWQFKMATKNASSSAYNVGLYSIIIRRTA